QHELGPLAVPGRIDRVHDDGTAAGRAHDVVAVHRVAAHPCHAVALLHGLLQPALEGAHFPACIAQLACNLAADASRRAEHQRHHSACHDPSPFCRIAMANSGHGVVQKELANMMYPLYIHAWTTTWDGSFTARSWACCGKGRSPAPHARWASPSPRWGGM